MCDLPPPRHRHRRRSSPHGPAYALIAATVSRETVEPVTPRSRCPKIAKSTSHLSLADLAGRRGRSLRWLQVARRVAKVGPHRQHQRVTSECAHFASAHAAHAPTPAHDLARPGGEFPHLTPGRPAGPDPRRPRPPGHRLPPPAHRHPPAGHPPQHPGSRVHCFSWTGSQLSFKTGRFWVFGQ
jgi:hypothetical protein